MKSLSGRELGMDRGIARRDFLNGVALGIAAAASLPGAETASDPPARDGLRGEYPEALAEFDRIRQGAYATFPVPDSEIREEYDLVIVVGGLSTLPSAKRSPPSASWPPSPKRRTRFPGRASMPFPRASTGAIAPMPKPA